MTETPEKCPVCNKTFNVNQSLRIHFGRMHAHDPFPWPRKPQTENTLLARLRAAERDAARLREALEMVATVPVDGNGRDYYWVGRSIAQKALAGLPIRAALAGKQEEGR
jgi:hypothetical protein